MATPWETMKQQQNGNALGKQTKLRSAPQGSKSCMMIINIITALSSSRSVIARSAAQSTSET
jgi:hypothetical protein